MDDNTAMVILLGALFGGIALVCIVFGIAWAVVERARERTRQAEIQNIKPPAPTPSSEQPWPEYEVQRITLPREGGED